MSNRKPKVTHPSQRKLVEKIKGAGTKLSQLNMDSKSSHLRSETYKGKGEADNRRNMHTVTDGRSSTGGYNQKKDGQRGYTSSSANGRMAAVFTDENGNKKYDTKNATTNLFTDKDNGYQSGRRKLTAKQKDAGEKNWQGNRRQRDYYVRVGLNNDQRSEESIARLRAAGLTDEEIGVGGGNGRYAITTG